MQNSITIAIIAAFSFGLCGCQIQQADPPIEGAWSEPVNGVRMMAMPIADSPYVRGSRTVLIFTQNVGDAGVNVPVINPLQFVTVRPDGKQRREEPQQSGNLRIQIESAQNEGIHGSGLYQDELREIHSLRADLMPGEVRVFALILKTDVAMQEMMQKLRENEIETATSHWTIHSPKPHCYRVYLSYRPDGFGSPSGISLRKVPDFTWSGKQIDLPPFELTISSTDRDQN
jgi:hypothetical protein